MAKIYLASPYGFSESSKGFLRDLREKLKSSGHTVHDPWVVSEPLVLECLAKIRRNPGNSKQLWHKLDMKIGKLNQKAIDKAEVVVAGLDGTDVDAGTASEIGYAFGRDKTVLGYREDFRLTGENEGMVVSVQVQYWIEQSGGAVFGKVSDVLKRLAKLDRHPKRR